MPSSFASLFQKAAVLTSRHEVSTCAASAFLLFPLFIQSPLFRTALTAYFGGFAYSILFWELFWFLTLDKPARQQAASWELGIAVGQLYTKTPQRADGAGSTFLPSIHIPCQQISAVTGQYAAVFKAGRRFIKLADLPLKPCAWTEGRIEPDILKQVLPLMQAEDIYRQGDLKILIVSLDRLVPNGHFFPANYCTTSKGLIRSVHFPFAAVRLEDSSFDSTEN